VLVIGELAIYVFIGYRIFFLLGELETGLTSTFDSLTDLGKDGAKEEKTL
jgi:hypothetical protein